MIVDDCLVIELKVVKEVLPVRPGQAVNPVQRLLDLGSGAFTVVIRHEGSLAHQRHKVVGVGVGFGLRPRMFHARV